ncbi:MULTISPECIES: RloB family protein [Methylobacterium]|jgi:hypothetical protein|uniref:RloB family protein n=2 Tax=Methylobacteriaceae TaxID=119045 RepID=UPI000B858B3E|nr:MULTISPECIES: RloB family protein [Methylobacterium]MBK3399669.1 RloB domain-containing protein [Methylobacterium ajmalii]MBK3407121.1 RloB domain-containing protein [Methylobacterium ajmalii]MBK3423368.1 RloB domain-containing protein [Methylobacterium ajmalii]
MRQPTNGFGKSLKPRISGKKRSKSRVIAVAYDGERTEDRYFKGWKIQIGTAATEIRPYYVKSGGNVLQAVEKCVQWLEREGPFEEIYCVCDTDDTTAENLRKAMALAASKNINLCLSTRSFEVWIALHWDGMSSAPVSSEDDAIALVAKNYKAYNKKCKEVEFNVLFQRTDIACRNAEALIKRNLPNPATDVHKLVRKLLNIYNKIKNNSKVKKK